LKDELLVPQRTSGRRMIAARGKLRGIDETLRRHLALRDTDKPVVQTQGYRRRRN
jgi:hypothetical protein